MSRQNQRIRQRHNPGWGVRQHEVFCCALQDLTCWYLRTTQRKPQIWLHRAAASTKTPHDTGLLQPAALCATSDHAPTGTFCVDAVLALRACACTFLLQIRCCEGQAKGHPFWMAADTLCIVYLALQKVFLPMHETVNSAVRVNMLDALLGE
jgi:hypothetical protein